MTLNELFDPEVDETEEEFENLEFDDGELDPEEAEIVDIDEGNGGTTSQSYDDNEGVTVKDDAGIEYFVPGRLVDEFDEADAEFANDDEGFWDWFADFRVRNDLQKTGKKSRRSGFGGGGWSSFWKGDNDKPKWQSSWALGGLHSTFKATSDNAARLAAALGAIQSTTRVIEPIDTRYTVRWTTESEAAPPASFTSLKEHIINVSAKAILDKYIEEGRAIDISCGWSLHEASHTRDTPEVAHVLDVPTPMSPVALASLLLNLAEDVLIEENTSAEFPGFAGYFETGNDYLWDIQQKMGTVPAKWGPDLKDKVNAAILIVKWPRQYEAIAKADTRLAKEWTWWRAWSDVYRDARASGNTRAHIQAALDHLRESSKGAADKMDQMAKAEQAAYDLAEKIRAGLKKLAKDGELVELCPTPGREHGEPGTPSTKAETGAALSDEEGEEVDRLVHEELRIDKPYVPWRDASETAKDTKIVVLRPDREAGPLPPMNGSLLARLRQAFKFRPVAREWHSRNMKSGRIDSPQLWRAADMDFRVFERKMVESRPDTSVTLLVDQSGSMGYDKLNKAIEAARVIHACLKDMNGVKLRVRSHTADSEDGGMGNSVVYRIWEQGEPMERLGMIHNLPHHNNADGFAIDWCVRELIEQSRPNEQRILIVLSDGQPAFSGYRWTGGGKGFGYQHVKEVVDWAERNGVFVCNIAVDDALHMSEQARMFKHWIPFQGLDKLPVQITGLLKRMF